MRETHLKFAQSVLQCQNRLVHTGDFATVCGVRAMCRKKFSKVSSTVIVYDTLSCKLTFEKFALRRVRDVKKKILESKLYSDFVWYVESRADF